MVKNVQYISIDEVLSRVLRHPKLQNVTKEQAIQYMIDFMGIVGLPGMFMDKEAEVDIKEYRGELPCDLISIKQVKEKKSDIPLRYNTDSFTHKKPLITKCGVPTSTHKEATFKTQGSFIYTSFPEGQIIIAYKSIPVDSNGYPMVPDNANFLKALELYIKQEVFTILFDTGKITPAILQNTQTAYAWAVGSLDAEFTIPSISEMESIKNMWCTLIQRNTEFNTGFKHLGDQEYLRRH